MSSTNWGIKQRVFLYSIVPAVTISLLLSVYFISIRVRDLSHALRDRGFAIATRLASNAEYGVFIASPVTLRNLAKEVLEKDSEVTSVAFYSNEGIEIASAGKLTNEIKHTDFDERNISVVYNTDSDTLAFITPVTLPEMVIDDYQETLESMHGSNISQAKVIGWVKVELDCGTTRHKEYQVIFHSIIIVVIGLGISGLLALRLGKHVSLPIIKLTNAVREIKDGNLRVRPDTGAKWELSVLESGINTMADALEEAHNKMQCNIDKATLELREILETVELQNIELEVARKAAENISKVKSEFLANMSHEIRTPLNAIVGFIGLFQKTTLSAQQQNYVSIISKSTNNLMRIINDVLDFSKIEAGKMNLLWEPMDLWDCVEESLILLAPSAYERGLELICFIYEEVPRVIVNDALRIKQVLTNLISNAIKFTEAGSVTVRVMLENINQADDQIILRISVTDTGVGLSDEQQKNLFSAFNELNPQISKKFKGTGLGLVICKKLVEQMHGEINVSSELGKGSNFWFTLKCKKISLHGDLENKVSQLFGSNILIYEEHSLSRLALILNLNLIKANVTECNNIDDILPATEIAFRENREFKVLIFGVDEVARHYATIQILSQELRELDCALIVLGNTTDDAVYNTLMQYGVHAYFSKPITRMKFYESLLACGKPSNTKQNEATYTVLAVDDNAANLKLIEEFLKDSDIEVVVAESGADAVLEANKRNFSLILMDINMPDLDGIEASKVIKQRSVYNQDTPIVVLTANIFTSQKATLADAKIDDCMLKPITETQLKNTFYKWVLNRNLKTMDIGNTTNIFGDKQELAEEMFQMLLKSLPQETSNINDAYNQKDYTLLRKLVHKLHGAACYCGVPKLKNILQQLESNIYHNANAKLIEGLMRDFNEEVEKLASLSDTMLETSS